MRDDDFGSNFLFSTFKGELFVRDFWEVNTKIVWKVKK